MAQSSIVKWGGGEGGGLGPAKNDKTGHSGFYDFRIKRYKIKIKDVKNLFGLLK